MLTCVLYEWTGMNMGSACHVLNLVHQLSKLLCVGKITLLVIRNVGWCPSHSVTKVSPFMWSVLLWWIDSFSKAIVLEQCKASSQTLIEWKFWRQCHWASLQALSIKSLSLSSVSALNFPTLSQREQSVPSLMLHTVCVCACGMHAPWITRGIYKQRPSFKTELVNHDTVTKVP